MNNYSKIRTTFLFGCSVGMLCFLAIWGFQPLNIFNVDWIMHPSGTDFEFTSIGAIDFLKEPWAFPPGIIKNLVYPNQTSIIYIDAIPLFALIFKLVAPLIPATFQYFGIWGILCFALQGGFAAIILRKYTSSCFLSVLASVFFVLSPFICGRMFAHISMSGQWILLLALTIVWYQKCHFIRQHEFVIWVITCGLSILIIPYLAAMVYSIFIIYIWRRLLESANRFRVAKQMIVLFLCTIAVCGILFWFCGGFIAGLEPSTMDYGIAPFNLNGFINPCWTSHVLKPLPEGASSAEGYGWFGLGIFIGLVLYFFQRIEGPLPNKHTMAQSAPFIVVSIGLIAFAATNNIMFGNNILFSYRLPDVVLKFFSVFRSSGRFIWPVYYMIYILVLGAILSRKSPISARAIILFLLLFTQIFDFSYFYKKLNKREISSENKTCLTSGFWKNLYPNYDHIYFIPFSGKVSHEVWAEISWAAVQSGITLNEFWLGRYPMKKIVSSMDQKTQELDQGKMGERDIVILNTINTLASVQFKENLSLYLINNLFVLLNKPHAALLPFKDIQKLECHRGSLAMYLNYLQEKKHGDLILLTARDRIPIKLDKVTELAFKQLGINLNFDEQSKYNLIEVIQIGGKNIYEEISSNALQWNSEKDKLIYPSLSGANINICVDSDYSRFPTVQINGLDCSQSYNGLNICVYDPKEKKMEEVAVFDLSIMKDGIWISNF